MHCTPLHTSIHTTLIHSNLSTYRDELILICILLSLSECCQTWYVAIEFCLDTTEKFTFFGSPPKRKDENWDRTYALFYRSRSGVGYCQSRNHEKLYNFLLINLILNNNIFFLFISLWTWSSRFKFVKKRKAVKVKKRNVSV